MVQLQFNQAQITQVEKDFNKLTFEPATRDILVKTARIYARFIPMSELAIRGFISMGLRDYQINNKFDMNEFAKLSPQDQAKIIPVVSQLVYERMAQVLIDISQKELLRKAIEEVHTAFKKGAI